jgi:predicted lipoprotein with Yx(FWY)xxD motif
MWRRHVTTLATAVAVGLTSVAGASPSQLVAVNAAQNAALGKILVNSKGLTLYHYSAEGKNAVRCTGTCAASWPPLLIAAGGKPIAGPGVTASLLGTVKRPDGKVQVTYGGKALYLYSGDARAGDLEGQGAGGTWHALRPTGAVVTKAVSSPAGSTAAQGSGSTSGSGPAAGAGSNTGGSGSPTTPPSCDANSMSYDCM